MISLFKKSIGIHITAMMELTVSAILLMLVTRMHVVYSLKGKDPLEIFGVVLLDSITFPKIVPSSSYSTVVVFAEKAKIGVGKYPTTGSTYARVSQC